MRSVFSIDSEGIVKACTRKVTTNTAITTGGNIPGNVVEVSVQGVNLAWMMPLSATLVGPFYTTLPLSLTVRSADILGGFPAGAASITR